MNWTWARCIRERIRRRAAFVGAHCRKPGMTDGFFKYDGALLSDAYREEPYKEFRKANAVWG